MIIILNKMKKNEKYYLLFWLVVLALSIFMAVGCKAIENKRSPSDDFDTALYFAGGCWAETDSGFIKE